VPCSSPVRLVAARPLATGRGVQAPEATRVSGLGLDTTDLAKIIEQRGGRGVSLDGCGADALARRPPPMPGWSTTGGDQIPDLGDDAVRAAKFAREVIGGESQPQAGRQGTAQQEPARGPGRE
jgi:hypothetical protein